MNARKSGKPDCVGVGATRRDVSMSIDFAVKLLSPRSRCARPGHESGAHDACEVAARAANRWPSSFHDVKQRSFVRSRGALLRPGLSVSSQVPSLSCPPASPRGLWRQRPSRQQQFRPPMRGGWSADRPHSSFRSRLRRATPLSRGDRDLSRRSTVAVFGCGPTKPAPGSGNRSLQRLPAPGHKAWRSGSGPPCGAVRAASAGRHSWLRLSGSFLENAPSEPGWQILYYKFVT